MIDGFCATPRRFRNVAPASAYRTEVVFTADRRFRTVRPLTGHKAFRLLTADR
ncbi:hypothetical protein [Streptomyces sp. NPDC007007]|uniref:hypothetical protein n=1 Tax=Streptomyces sp. NPDC007007 TaxID=3364770 RepID=UPI003688D769